MTARVNVVPGDDAPAHDVLAQAIVDIANSMKLLNGSRLKPDTIAMLVSRGSGVGMRDVQRVLECLSQLEATYLKPKVR